jgi:hypothetical protein
MKLTNCNSNARRANSRTGVPFPRSSVRRRRLGGGRSPSSPRHNLRQCRPCCVTVFSFPPVRPTPRPPPCCWPRSPIKPRCRRPMDSLARPSGRPSHRDYWSVPAAWSSPALIPHRSGATSCSLARQALAATDLQSTITAAVRPFSEPDLGRRGSARDLRLALGRFSASIQSPTHQFNVYDTR